MIKESLFRSQRTSRQALVGVCVPEPPPGFNLPTPVPNMRLWVSWACEQGVAALLHANFMKLGGRLESEGMERLERFAWDCAFASEQARETVSRIAQKANSASVDLLFLKGVTLARRYYPQEDKRPVNDVDVYARFEDLDSLDAILRVLGYKKTREDGSERAYLAQNRLTPVEVHWRFVNSARLRANLAEEDERLWQNAARLSFSGVAVAIPGHADSFRHACIHAAHHHQFSRIIWLVDILQIIQAARRDNVSVNDLCEGAHSPGERLAIGAALRFVVELFPWARAEIPPGFLPRNPWTALLFYRLSANAILTSESRWLKFRRKLFREALKLHG